MSWRQGAGAGRRCVLGILGAALPACGAQAQLYPSQARGSFRDGAYGSEFVLAVVILLAVVIGAIEFVRRRRARQQDSTKPDDIKRG